MSCVVWCLFLCSHGSWIRAKCIIKVCGNAQFSQLHFWKVSFGTECFCNRITRCYFFLSVVEMILQRKKVSRGQRKAVHHVLHVRTSFSSPRCGIHDPLCRRTELHASPDQENDWWVCLVSLGGVAVAYNMHACFLPIFICLLGLAIAIVRGRFPEEMLPKTFEREKV